MSLDIPTPHPLAHGANWFLSRFYAMQILKKQVNLTIVHERPFSLKPPFIIMANHACFMDPWLVGQISRFPLHIMMNDDGFRGSRGSAWYLRNVGAFPKKKAQNDFRAMKRMLGYLRAGKPALLFPEGQSTWSGVPRYPYPGIEKIVRKVGCDLILGRLRGNFLTRPWWADTARKGSIELTLRKIDGKEIQSMNNDRLFETIRDYIYNNDLVSVDPHTTPFSGSNLAEGLQWYLWWCPVCSREDHLKVSGNSISCTSCAASWDLDPYLSFHPENKSSKTLNLQDWIAAGEQNVLSKINAHSKNADTIISDSQITLKTESDNGVFNPVSSGQLELDSKKITFTPSSQTAAPLEIPLTSVVAAVVQRRSMLEVSLKECIYRFELSNRSPMKWAYYINYSIDPEFGAPKGYSAF